jgi:RNA polymerase sigma factor (sigma-70 family)
MESMSGELGGLPVDVSPGAGARLFGDARLARLAARGDRRALEGIYRRHYQELYRYCRAIVRDPHDAEDALQSTMAKVAAALPGETREISLRPWLFRIAHNEAISVLRARRPTAELDQESPALGTDVEQEAENRDRLRQLVRDLDRLPERQRGALIMRELSGLGFDELGASFGITPEAAKQAVYEARLALQEMSAGHEMDCGSVRQAISDGDRRRLRGRRFRAHLSDCDGCADFAAAIDRRRSDLAALAPPIALPAALTALHAAVGAGATGAAAGGAGSATGIGAALGGSAAAKSAAAVLAAVAIAGGGAGVGGLLDLNGGGGRADDGASAPARVDQPAGAQPATGEAGPSTSARQSAPAATPGSQRRGSDARPGHRGHHHPHSAHAANSASAAGASPPGQTRTPPGQQSTPPGQASTPPGQSADPPTGASSPSVSHSNPQAQTSSSSVTHSQASTAAAGGGKAAAPGQTGATDPTPRGNAYGPLADRGTK